MKIRLVLYLKRARAIPLVFLLMVLCSHVNAQSISGVVKAADGKPLADVTVRISDSTVGTSTNAKGEYTVTVPQGKTKLEFSFLGYETLVVQIGGKKSIDVQLNENTVHMDDVVIVGYGTMLKSDLSGSISSVNLADKEFAPQGVLENILQGR